MKLKLLVVFCILLYVPKLFGQENNISNTSEDNLHILDDSISNHLIKLKYDLALELSVQMINKATIQGDDYFNYLGHINIGTVYTYIKDTLQARLNFEKALKLAQKTENDSLISGAYLHLGNNESDQKENYQKGIDYYQKSIALNKKCGLERHNLSPYLNIGWTYLDENQEDKALPFLLKAKGLTEKLHGLTLTPSDWADMKTLLGRYYLKKKNYTLAKTYLEEASVIIQKYDMPLEGADTYKYYTILAKEEGNHEAAYDFLLIQRGYENRLNEANIRSEIQAVAAKFNIEQYKKDLEVVRREKMITDQLVKKSRLLNIIFIIASAVLLGILIIIFFAFKLRKKLVNSLRDKNKLLQVAKENAEKLSKLKTQFFSTVSHELRTPLYGVIGITSILMEDKTLTKQRDDLKSLKFSADYLLSLINDVLLINKMDANGVALLYTSFNIEALTKSIINSLQFNLEQNNNKIHLNIDKALPSFIVGDSVRLSQILMNLIGNAVKFNDHGNIWLDINLIEKTEDQIYRTEFRIEDDGIGIPMNKQQSIFKEFSQIETRNYNYQGTGLGLSIVKKLLKLYNSEIKLESTLGKGSVFSFIIDCKASDFNKIEKQSVEEPTSDVEDSLFSKDIHILIVDDNRINQKVTQRILEKRYFKCSLSDDGTDAIEMVKNNEYDLILMDIHMPGVNGIDATKAIRRFNAHIPILALTAVELDEMRTKILESGMNDIILKPYDVSDFLTIILRNIHMHQYSTDQESTTPHTREVQ